MKKHISFDRIMIVLILIVLSFSFYKTNEAMSVMTSRSGFNEKNSCPYYMYDAEGDKLVGFFNSSTTVQKGQIIFLDDDAYKVKSIRCFLKKDKGKNILYSEHAYGLIVEFLGKSKE
jgi:hypothetical protein